MKDSLLINLAEWQSDSYHYELTPAQQLHLVEIDTDRTNHLVDVAMKSMGENLLCMDTTEQLKTYIGRRIELHEEYGQLIRS